MDLALEEKFRQYKMEKEHTNKQPIRFANKQNSSFPLLAESVKGVAHDMRNFLSAITGYLELVKMDPKKSDLIDNALKAVDMASELNLRLLNPKQKNPIKVNIASVIEKTTVAIIGSSKVKFSLSTCPNLEDLLIDELLLERAIQNILINSIEAIGDKDGTINISTCGIEQGCNVVSTLNDQRYIQISIKDSGGGIPEEYSEMIMKPYFSTKATGSGLGLAIAKEIINSLNGVIEVASADGAGTMIAIYLPVEN
ncbi:MAG: hypothetical protein D8M58_11515 [Calditrichaeota bacterium]|nr:MAG: hypothetical protein DWQ03_10890 [Calditrichota bacterium]MBL1206022.1 hypothetical protein [Calditrichota bacterium]NOG45850.1 hypothetical protein [Calditrichota bacterium]